MAGEGSGDIFSVDGMMDFIKYTMLQVDFTKRTKYVACGTLNNNNLDLKAIETELPSMGYMHPDILQMDFFETQTGAYLSHSGKVLCGGYTSSENDVIAAAQKIAAGVSKSLGQPVDYLNGIKVEAKVPSEMEIARMEEVLKLHEERMEKGLYTNMSNGLPVVDD